MALRPTLLSLFSSPLYNLAFYTIYLAQIGLLGIDELHT